MELIRNIPLYLNFQQVHKSTLKTDIMVKPLRYSILISNDELEKYRYVITLIVFMSHRTQHYSRELEGKIKENALTEK
jgi:hypothetical protein